MDSLLLLVLIYFLILKLKILKFLTKLICLSQIYHFLFILLLLNSFLLK